MKRTLILLILMCFFFGIVFSLQVVKPFDFSTPAAQPAPQAQPTGSANPGSSGLAIDTAYYGKPAVEATKSVIYYFKVLNLNILESSTGITFKKTGKTEEQVTKIVTDAKASVSPEQKNATNPAAPVDNTSWNNSVTWSDVLTTTNSTIVFPSVKVDGVNKQLKLNFMPRGADGVANIDVFVNNENVKCYQGWGRFLNNWFGTSLVFGWGEGSEACEATVIKNMYVVDITMSTSGNYKQFSIKSPLIPTACDKKTLSQNNANSAQILNVTC